ncbi:carnitine acetyltransferase [Moniliophthora roreri]|nr:carnitine acetyltransferase [Moniliophthora roreri]
MYRTVYRKSSRLYQTMYSNTPAARSLNIGFGFAQPNANEQAPKPVVLPRLPIPDLRSTMEKYLKSLEPFLMEDAVRGGAPYEDAYALRKEWADDFCSGIGKTCQERLQALDRESPNNWLNDNFWLKTYLEWRAPLLVNSNWWLAFYDDDLHPITPVPVAGHTNWQMKRAAWLVHRTLEFKNKVDAQEVHPDTTRTGVWFRENVSKMFNVCRIPKTECDVLSMPPSPTEPSAQCIVVVVNNWFYSLRTYEPQSSDSETPILSNPEVILSRLHAIVQDARNRAGYALEIGVLSADERDRWATNLRHLLSISERNRVTHQAIVNSLMCLSLDSETHIIPSRSSSLPPPTGTTQENLDSHLHSIRGVSSNVSNRWFDKPFTLIVDPSGRAGAMGEHSPCDALVPSIVAEYAIVQGVDRSLAVYPHHAFADSDQGWSRLDWDTDEAMLSACVEARKNAERIIEDSDDSVFWFEEFGTDWMRDVRLSPDAFIQTALQLAWYRTQGYFTATYETALTRMFNKGRTETIRTLSTDSRAFVLSMDDPAQSIENKASLLQRTIRTHTSLTREAMTGRGIDRHLLGLRCMLRDQESAEILNDPLFSRSQQWCLSTSGLSAGHWFRGTGFGAVYPDGYGINYLAAPNVVKFGIECKHSNSSTSTEEFKKAVAKAMSDMRSICIQLEATRTPLPSRL